MKKLKVALTSFCVLILLSVLLISCEQEAIDLNDMAENAAIEQTSHYRGLLLPNDVIERGEAYIIDFLNNASEKDIVNYHNDYITFNFLEEVGKLGKILNKNNQVVLENVDISTILSPDEMSTLNDRLAASVATITYRGDDAGGGGGGGWCICIPTSGGCRWWCP